MGNMKQNPQIRKNIKEFVIIVASYIIFSNYIYIKAGLSWTNTLIGWDSTRYIGLAKLILQDSTFLRLYAPFLFPSLLALGIYINSTEYFWAVIWYRVIETLAISSIIYITANDIGKPSRYRLLNYVYILLQIISFKNFILSMYMPFTLALLFSIFMVIIGKKIMLENNTNIKSYLFIGFITLMIIVSNNIYHVLLALLGLVIYFINNRKIVSKINFFKMFLTVVFTSVFSYLILSRVSIAYAVALAQIMEPVRHYLPESLQALLYYEPFERYDPLFKNIIDNFAKASHLIVLNRPASLSSAISFYYFNDIEFFLLLFFNILLYVYLIIFRREVRGNIILNYYFGILMLLTLSTFLLISTKSNYFVTYLFRFNGIYDLRVFFFVLLLLWMEKYEFNFFKFRGLQEKLKRYKRSIIVLLAIVSLVSSLTIAYLMAPRLSVYAFVTDSDISFIKQLVTHLAVNKNTILITNIARYSYPGILNQLEGLVWFYGGSNYVIFPLLELKDICMVNQTFKNIAYNFTFDHPLLNLLQYYYGYAYFEKLMNLSNTSTTIIISEIAYKAKYERIFEKCNELIYNSCYGKYCAFILNTLNVCKRC